MDDGQLPLVKVIPGEFAMVKLDESGEPEKNTTGVDGVSVEDGVVTFDEVAIGDAVVDGSASCTSHSED